jgi:hypothetical protein
VGKDPEPAKQLQVAVLNEIPADSGIACVEEWRRHWLLPIDKIVVGSRDEVRFSHGSQGLLGRIEPYSISRTS